MCIYWLAKFKLVELEPRFDKYFASFDANNLGILLIISKHITRKWRGRVLGLHKGARKKKTREVSVKGEVFHPLFA